MEVILGKLELNSGSVELLCSFASFFPHFFKFISKNLRQRLP